MMTAGGADSFPNARLSAEVSTQELGHAESPDAVSAEDLGHLLVGGEVLLVLGVLEVVLLDVGPQLLDAIGAGGLLLADDVSELSRELHGLGESGSLRHFELLCLAWLSGIKSFRGR